VHNEELNNLYNYPLFFGHYPSSCCKQSNVTFGICILYCNYYVYIYNYNIIIIMYNIIIHGVSKRGLQL
jgi:hypothetical protein